MPLSNVVLAAAVAEDRSYTSIAAAGRLDGEQVGVELAAYLDGVGTALAEVTRLYRERAAVTVVIDPHAPGATLIAPLKTAGLNVTEPSTSEVVVAHGGFLDELNAGRVKVARHPALDNAARHGMQRPLAGASMWDRRTLIADLGPILAAELAVWCLLHAGPQPFFAEWR